MGKHRREAWKDYAEWGQRDRAVWWLMHVRYFSKRAAESYIDNYLENEAPRK